MKTLFARSLLALSLCAGTAQAKDLILAISEGTSGGTDHARVIAKYQGLADVIGKSINQKVNVVFIREFSSLEEGMKERRFALAMARPSDFPARGMRDYGYQYVASAKPDGQCLIVVPKESTYKTVADIKGKRLVLPEPAAYMAKFCASALRDAGIDIAKENVQRVREQGAVPFYLTNKFADVGGVASYSGVAKSLDKSGHRVLHTSVSQPYFPLIVDREFTPAQIEAMQKALRALPESEAGQAVLKSVGIQAFDTSAEKKLRELLGWLGL
ncbi:MAG: PhnD/SsuA/transferrin family substrate-binding protein [Hydrogenophaga sp.]|uniref:phosphate/phosphite/phosphonate ABC transporter substrate-binding protein n=1 Tax=Hydrogenophaga sp. TaxID=1904254 RepID=UPI00260F63DE|nr:PhnD/SsuA/transferrin family substrate-binding protein [Hydrogenophaga sp.]MCW5671104.1 PhnD/SsuA/transferrin family substrate-binding protein [Hydrogenophaga sp.]